MLSALPTLFPTEDGLRNAQEAEQRYAQKKAELTRQIEANAQALAKLKSQSGDTSEEQKRLTEEDKRLNDELKKNEDYLTSAKKAVNNWQTDLNKAKTAVNETEAAVKQNSDALDNNRNKTKGNAEAFNALAAALVASGLKRGLEDIAKALTDCVDASTGFESAMAGVAKTTNLSDSELSAMGNQIKQLSTEIPIANTELAGIVETAGQLGISKNNLVEFATVMANLGVATNLTADEAATMLARFANVTKMSPDLYENLGSVVVALGNNFATTESEIVSMGQRLAAAGELAGMTEPEIMALAAAMSSVGIEAEAGGSAMSQTMNAIEKAVASGGDDVKKFAEVAGMSAEDFSSAWESKPAEAIQAFITGLGSLDEKGESATLVIDDLGLSGIRQENMLKSLGLASDVLASSINVANAAWADNTALAKEASTRYETTESKMAMFKNSVVNLKVAVGDQLTPALGNLADKGTDVVEWATEFVQENEWLAPTIVAVTTAVQTLGIVLGGTIAIIKLIKPLIEALNGTLVANPVFLVAAGITAVTTALIALAATTPSVTQEADRLNDAMNDTAKTFEAVEETYESTSKNIDATAKVVDAYIDRLVDLEKQSSLTNEEQDEYKRLVGQISELLPEANTAINENTGFLEEGAAALHKNVEEWKLMAQNAANASRIKAMSDSLTNAYIMSTEQTAIFSGHQ